MIIVLAYFFNFFEKWMRIIRWFLCPIIFDFGDFIRKTFELLLKNFLLSFMAVSFWVFENWKRSFEFFYTVIIIGLIKFVISWTLNLIENWKKFVFLNLAHSICIDVRKVILLLFLSNRLGFITMSQKGSFSFGIRKNFVFKEFFFFEIITN